jgi:hypothetical protein
MIFVNSNELIKQIEFFKNLNVCQMLYFKGRILIIIDDYVFIKRNPVLINSHNVLHWEKSIHVNYKYINNFITFPIETSSFEEIFNDLMRE